MTADLDLAGLAARLGRSYSWTQRHWRTHRHGHTGAPLPRPYLGAGRGERPLWTAAAIEAWKAGAAETSGDFTQRAPGDHAPAAPANDPIARRPASRAQALIAAAGGS